MPTYRWILGFWFACLFTAHADLVEMQNGDRYVGTVVSLNADSLVLQSEVLGKVLLSRSQVSTISLGKTQAPVVSATNTAIAITNTGIAEAFRKLGSGTNTMIPKIREQFLAGAGPEANAKFNELLGGLASGQVDMNGLRAQAQASVDQIKSLKGQLGSEAGESLDVYLGILQGFLNESAVNPTVTTNAPPVR